MKKIVIMGEAKSGKSTLLADYIRNGEDSALLANWFGLQDEDSILPKLVLDFNDNSLFNLLEKNTIITGVFQAENRKCALEHASYFAHHNKSFMLVIDQARVTMSNHTMIDVAKELQLLYGDKMGVILTTGLSSDKEVNAKILDRLLFTLGLTDAYYLNSKEIENVNNQEVQVVNLYSDKVEKTINIGFLEEKYYTGQAKQ